jgi:hypothetical protein
LTGDVLAQRPRRHLQLSRERGALKDRRIVLHDAPHQHSELGLRVGERHAILEPGHHAVIEPAAPLRRLLIGERHRYPHVRRRVVELRPAAREDERRRHDADDRVRLAIERDRLPDRAGASAVAPLPQRPTDQRDVAARPILRRRDRASERRIDAQQRKEAGRNPRAHDPLGIAGSRQLERHVEEGPDGLKRLLLPLEVEQVWWGEGRAIEAGAGRALVEGDELLGRGEAQRPDQQRVDQAEHGRVGADAERQNEHHHDGKAGRACQAAGGVAKVVEEAGHGMARDSGLGARTSAAESPVRDPPIKLHAFENCPGIGRSGRRPWPSLGLGVPRADSAGLGAPVSDERE